MLVLASQSPRRMELLAQLGVQFEQRVADINEDTQLGEKPYDYVKRLAIAKASTVQARYHINGWVLGSDTTVTIDDTILEKPIDYQDYVRMMTLLSGKTHVVYTAIALVNNEQILTDVVRADVTFKPLTKLEIEHYWQTNDPKDKAGGYGIQSGAGKFVTNINGSYFAIVGLPLYETAKLLTQAQLLP